MEPIITYLPRHMKTHFSLQRENVLIRTPFPAAESTQSKKSDTLKQRQQPEKYPGDNFISDHQQGG